MPLSGIGAAALLKKFMIPEKKAQEHIPQREARNYTYGTRLLHGHCTTRPQAAGREPPQPCAHTTSVPSPPTDTRRGTRGAHTPTHSPARASSDSAPAARLGTAPAGQSNGSPIKQVLELVPWDPKHQNTHTHPKHRSPAHPGTAENLFPRAAVQEKAGTGEERRDWGDWGALGSRSAPTLSVFPFIRHENCCF